MLKRDEILSWLKETDAARLRELWKTADEVRRKHVGDDVHLRGLVEISNHCVRQCHYCGIRAGNRELQRYRMTRDEILECARQAVMFGYGTVVLQAGEDPVLDAGWMEGVVKAIKSETGLAVTLSLGERTLNELEIWKRAGADRYLMRFETSNRALFDSIHPPAGKRKSDRIKLLREIRKIGYEVGSGVMVGIPGQTWDDMANDILMFRELDLDMIGIGPFIAHPGTPLGGFKADELDDRQTPNSELVTYKVLALARLVCPHSNIPSTTALATLNLSKGRELGLQRGANIVMPNLTPAIYRRHYEIYPAKACIQETADRCHTCIKGRIKAIRRQVGTGPGNSPNLVMKDRIF
jgi:biotin synthase